MKTHQPLDEVFDDCLDAIQDGHQTIDSILNQYPQQADKLQPGLEAALWLTDAKQALEPRPGFIASSRSYLERRYSTIQPHGFWQRLFIYHRPQRWVFNIAAPIILIILLALVANSLGLAAQLSNPGDLLYSTKIIIEDTRLAVTFRQEERARLSIQSSRERMAEFVELVLEGKYELLPQAALRMEGEMVATLQILQDSLPEARAQEQSMTNELKETLANEVFLLDTLKGTSPPSARAGIDMAILDAQSVIMALR